MVKWIALAVAVVVAACYMATVRPYGVPFVTENGGVTVTFLHGGVEVWGRPGVFSCADVGC